MTAPSLKEQFRMAAMSQRLLLGFAAAALSHIIFQGALGTIFYAANIVPELIWSLAPVPPFAIPTTLNNMFWDGLWGMIYASLEPRLTARFGRLPGGAIFGFAPLMIFWFVVLPLKGAGVGGGFHGAEVAIDVAFDTAFGIGTAIIYWGGLLVLRWRLASTSQR